MDPAERTKWPLIVDRHLLWPMNGKPMVGCSYRKVSSVERVDDEGFVADVDDAADSAARSESRYGARIIFDRPVVVTMLDFLARGHDRE